MWVYFIIMLIAFFFIWATSWENLFMPYVNNKGADQPAHPCSLISTFVVCCLDSIISIHAKSKISRLQLVSETEQASFSQPGRKPPKTGFLMTWLNYSLQIMVSTTMDHVAETFCSTAANHFIPNLDYDNTKFTFKMVAFSTEYWSFCHCSYEQS